MRVQWHGFVATRPWRLSLLGRLGFLVSVAAAVAGSVTATAADIPSTARPPAKTAVLLDFGRPVPQPFLNALTEEIRVPARAALPSSTVWLLRSDFVMGEEFPRLLQVQFRGNCGASELSTHATPGPLGWVFQEGGSIHPIAFVDCDRIAATLSAITRAMPPRERQQMMARAVARVMIHELVHIQAQSSRHVAHSIEQQTLTAGELIAQKLPGGF